MKASLMALMLCTALAAQDESKKRVERPVVPDRPKSVAEMPIKKIIPRFVAKDQVEAPVKIAVGDTSKFDVEALLKEIVIAPAPEKYDLAKTGITWHEGLDAVVNKGRPILLFQLLGNFDDVYC